MGPVPGIHADVDAVAAVSGPGQWYYRGTPRMRQLHRLVLGRSGRAAIRLARGTRISRQGWTEPYPLDPVAAAGHLDVPPLVVHGDLGDYFSTSHAERVSAAPGSMGAPGLGP